MTVAALGIVKDAFSACVIWTNQLFSAVDGSGVVLAGFCIVLVVSLLFIPMRGMAVWRGMDSLSDFSSQATYKGKFSKSRKSFAKQGTFVKGSDKNAKQRLRIHYLNNGKNIKF